MVEALREFHRTKDAILKAKTRCGAKGAVKNDFNIPTLERFQSFLWNIMNNTTLIQYTTYVTERLHTTLCKIPFELANQNIDKFIGQYFSAAKKTYAALISLTLCAVQTLR